MTRFVFPRNFFFELHDGNASLATLEDRIQAAVSNLQSKGDYIELDNPTERCYSEAELRASLGTGSESLNVLT